MTIDQSKSLDQNPIAIVGEDRTCGQGHFLSSASSWFQFLAHYHSLLVEHPEQNKKLHRKIALCRHVSISCKKVPIFLMMQSLSII
jgi:hypothetical protein